MFDNIRTTLVWVRKDYRFPLNYDNERQHQQQPHFMHTVRDDRWLAHAHDDDDHIIDGVLFFNTQFAINMMCRVLALNQKRITNNNREFHDIKVIREEEKKQPNELKQRWIENNLTESMCDCVCDTFLCTCAPALELALIFSSSSSNVIRFSCKNTTQCYLF